MPVWSASRIVDSFCSRTVDIVRRNKCAELLLPAVGPLMPVKALENAVTSAGTAVVAAAQGVLVPKAGGKALMAVVNAVCRFPMAVVTAVLASGVLVEIEVRAALSIAVLKAWYAASTDWLKVWRVVPVKLPAGA